ncbi:glycoside hydrolase family 15 protein [Paraburkholderia kirstenboschensis]|uniref:glycoside hydrolase family 15 protein n=1 Tax=Paraburkholderia kirstenboschensis TaxID=1245436 RepID=UPI0022A8B5A8|nr:glycoside hydrolase family 15 protein [Paraburkholderia kirstenboschensis]
MSADCRGLIGNMKTTALVSTHGSIDFMCFPRMDSPTIFAALLDEDGGQFSITPSSADFNSKQMYLPATNVLLTRFMTGDGVCELVDFMPVVNDSKGKLCRSTANCVVRTVKVLLGSMRLSIRCQPRFNYGRTGHAVEPTQGGFRFVPDDGEAALLLVASASLACDRGAVEAIVELGEGDTLSIAFGVEADFTQQDIDCEALLGDTTDFWKRWSAQSSYRGRYREMVLRSALTLKLLSSSEHGAIIAAPTFGLAESQDGSRKWDYRFTWIRDAAFSVYALLRLGYTEEAEHFMQWIADRNRDCASDGSLQVMYAVDGESVPEEEALESFSGSTRGFLIGNAARDQKQLDVYGALLDAVYLYNKYGVSISYEGWRHVARTVQYVVNHWREADNGIWELRNGTRPLLHSRLMCWVTIDRALRLAEKRSLPAPFSDWFAARDDIYRDIHENFWSHERNSFVQTPGSTTLDASVLMMPLVRFIGPQDPRWTGTLDAIGGELCVDPLVFRYTRGSTLDGLPGTEGGFSACSFWYAEALARSGRVEEGRLVFEKMMAYANHLGLFSEEVATTGESLGNFPQALTHLALISAAYRLDRDLDGKHVPWT